MDIVRHVDPAGTDATAKPRKNAQNHVACATKLDSDISTGVVYGTL